MALFALLLGLNSTGALARAVQYLEKKNIFSFLVYLETGHTVRFSPSLEEETQIPTETAEPSEAPPAVPAVAVFAPGEADAIQITDSAGKKPDLQALLSRPLNWDLQGEQPTVLILHTHGTESYTQAAEDTYEASAAFRTLDPEQNMISIGDHVAQLLEAGGIRVIHDRALHDYPSYNGSYSDARSALREYLQEYPSIQLVLDLHRDASGDNFHQLRTEASVDGKKAAQLMLVIGTNHKLWQENTALALKLYIQLERLAPGINRPLQLRTSRFNQDLLPGALLVEVGAAGNTRQEALRAAEVLAQAILALRRGAVTESFAD